MPFLLVITEAAYALLEREAGEEGDWTELTRLPGGASAVLPSVRPIDEAALESAIEISENWLMPCASRLRGNVLEVEDTTGRLRRGLSEVLSISSETAITAIAWSVEDIEHIFLRLVDLATGRKPLAALQERRMFVADVVVLRELAHHGQLAGIALR